MAFSMAGGGPSGPQINVTPLIDVLLTLIVVFMIVVAMEQDKGERVQIPQPQTQQTPEQKQSRTIVIQLVWTAKDQPPELKINGEQVERDDLEARLAEIFLKRAEKVAFVRGDDDVDFQDVADVIDVGAPRRRAAGRPADKGERMGRG
jgi:biopolymer transport protein ExbD